MSNVEVPNHREPKWEHITKKGIPTPFQLLAERANKQQHQETSSVTLVEESEDAASPLLKSPIPKSRKCIVSQLQATCYDHTRLVQVTLSLKENFSAMEKPVRAYIDIRVNKDQVVAISLRDTELRMIRFNPKGSMRGHILNGQVLSSHELTDKEGPKIIQMECEFPSLDIEDMVIAFIQCKLELSCVCKEKIFLFHSNRKRLVHIKVDLPLALLPDQTRSYYRVTPEKK